MFRTFLKLKIIILKIYISFKKVYLNYNKYLLIGSNIAVNNAFFFSEDLVKDLQILYPAQAFKSLSFSV